MTKPAIYEKDGRIHIAGNHGEKFAEYFDEDGHLGGGYKIKPVVESSEDGEVIIGTEIINSATGSFFTSDTGFGFSSFQQAFRTAVIDRKEFLKEGYRLWKFDPLGGTIVNLTTFFVMGRGIVINYNNPVDENVLKKFWKNNKMHRRIKQMCDEGTAFGENFIKLKLHRQEVLFGGRILWHAGDVEVSTIDPLNIEAVEHAADDVSNVFSYHISFTDETDNEIREIIPDISKFNPNFDEACVLHVKFNAACNDPFGLSDLVRIKEWLDNYQEFLRDSVIINKLYRSPCYDITIEDGTETDILNAKRRYANWKIGSNPVHNDKEKWDVLEFTGVNMSSEDSRRALLLIVAAGVGFPEYMLADGSNSNLASTKSQQLPAIKRFEDRQDVYMSVLLEMFDFALRMKSSFGSVAGLTPEIDFEGDEVWRGEVRFPVIAQEEDSAVASTTIGLVESGLMALSTASLKNGTSYEVELKRKFDDAINLGKAIVETRNELKKIEGLTEEEVDSILAKCFPALGGGVMPERPEPGEEDNDPGSNEPANRGETVNAPS